MAGRSPKKGSGAPSALRRVRRRVARLQKGTQNAVELMRMGRFGKPYHAPYEVLFQTSTFRLRRYLVPPTTPPIEGPLLLVPPLMLTAEVYDIAPEISAVGALTRDGIDTWVVDFGAPEREQGGMARTLDDHVRAVSEAVEQVRRLTGRDVHLAGYSQGGMFCYQVAAFRRSQGIASVVTFGSPVDIHRNLPVKVDDRLVDSMVQSVRGAVMGAFERVDGLPGAFTSTAFKLFSARREVSQIVEFFSNLHDRRALERRESRRLFLGGEGFVAWPGPALRTFIDEFIVHNRMLSGGFVIEGRTVTLADIVCPILYFVGTRDDLARPASVVAIDRAAPDAERYRMPVDAGHFGLVVGSRSLSVTWPCVIEWVRWHSEGGQLPTALAPTRNDVDASRAVEPEIDAVEDASFERIEYDASVLFDAAEEALESVRGTVRRAARGAVGLAENVRWQLPRLARLRSVRPSDAVSLGAVLERQAERVPDGTFFLWQGRAFSYRDADRRVNYVVRGLYACGVRQGARVAIHMRNRPSYLTLVAALSRMGAVAVLTGPTSTRVTVADVVAMAGVEIIITEPESAGDVRAAFEGLVLVLGGGTEARTLPDGVVDMEAIDPDAVELESEFLANPGRASDLAMIVFASDAEDRPVAVRITNKRWYTAALGAAAAATLNERDTVYCPLPLFYSSAMLLAVSGALIGGARLALASGFRADTFWTEVRRYGASVAFHAGEMCRELVDTRPRAGENNQPLRLFVGSGLHADVWRRLLDRFGPVGVLEYYATTEGNAVLANLSGKRIGSSGRPLPGTAEVALLRWSFTDRAFVRDTTGRLQRCGTDEVGMLVARLDPSNPLSLVDGFVDASRNAGRILHDVTTPGDRWFVTGDLFRVDRGGEYWHVDRVSDALRVEGEMISSRAIEEALVELPFVRRAAAYPLTVDGSVTVVAAAVVVHDAFALDTTWLTQSLIESIGLRAVPRFVRRVDTIPLTDGYRPMRARLAADGLRTDGTMFYFDPERLQYRPLNARSKKRACAVAHEAIVATGEPGGDD